MSRSMYIHIIATPDESETVHRLVQHIRQAGHQTWDWTCEPAPAFLQATSVLQWRSSAPGYLIFRERARSCAAADLVVALGGDDAMTGREAGVAYVFDIPSVSLPDEKAEQSFWDELSSLEDFITMLRRFYPPCELFPLAKYVNRPVKES